MKVDLNLFIVFDAIFCEGNITKAALALNLSQPAISHSLGKLRVHFDDPLFIRQGNKMKPTLVANNVIADVREALHQLQVCLLQSKQFDPLASRKHFTLSLHGSLEASYLPLLTEHLSKKSPYIKLKSRKRVWRKELENKLASGDINLAIDTLLPVSENVLHTQLQESQLVVIARKNHPTFNTNISLETYLEQNHIVASSRSTGSSVEDFELGRLGLQRKIGLRCQHTFAACRVVISSDMLLTLPISAAIMYSEIFDIIISPLPVKLPNLDVHLYWHTNVDLDPANKWLREQLIITASKENI